MELELKMKRLQLESIRGSSRDSLSSISSSLRAKTKTDNWLNSESNVFDCFAAHDNHKSNCPDVTSNTLAPTRRQTVKPATIDHKSFNLDSGDNKTSLVYDPSKTFIPSTNPIHAATFPTSQVNPSTMLPVMGLKLPKLVLDKFSGDPLEWPEWSGQFLSTVDEAVLDDNVKMKYLKTLVTGKARAAIEGMGYNGSMYRIAWETLSRDFGRPELVVNAQLRKIHSYPFIKPHDASEIIKFSHIVCSCVNVLTQFGFESDINSESVLNSAVKKLPINLKAKWLSYLQRYDSSFKTMRVFSAWLKNIAEIQDNLKMQFGTTTEKNSNRDKQKTTAFTSEVEDKTDLPKGKCPLSDGDHKIWNCPAFKKMTPDQRGDSARKFKLCFCCLNGGHRANQCSLKRTCGRDGCAKKHNRLLHRDQKTVSEPKTSDCSTNPVLTANACSGLLQVVSVRLSNGTKKVDTFAVCDTGSTLSFIDDDIRRQLHVEGEKLTLSVAGINGTKDMVSERVAVELFTKDHNEVVHFHVHPKMYLGNRRYDYSHIKEKYHHLKVLPNNQIELKDVKVVIGKDNFHLLFPVEYRKGKKNEPWAIKTKLGWTLSGPLPKHEIAQIATVLATCDDDQLSDQVKLWWSMESYSSTFSVSGRSHEDKKALEILEKTIRLIEGRYEVGLLWADNKVIPKNYVSAYTQLCSLERRLEKNPDLKKRYEATINVDLENEHVRRLEDEKLSSSGSDPQWYVPHHPVINPNKPEKVRRVCNAASKFKGVSLNDKLVAGPDLLQNLIGIIFRFRQSSIAMTADIEAMFLQVKVPSAECKFLRFLWRDDSTKPVKVYEYTRHVFGAKSSPTCANYALQQTGRDNKDFYPLASKAIERNFYMDDFAKSVDTEEEAIELYNQLKTALIKGGFNLTKWITNNSIVMNSFKEGDRAESTTKMFEAEPAASSLLGLQWNMEEDTLEVCRGVSKEIPSKITQRVVLSFVASVFDPLGVFAPFTMRMRILLKTTWAKCGQLWDEMIAEDNKSSFLQWVSELQQLKEMNLERNYFTTKPEVVELHIFSDASLEAMCMVAYLRAETANGVQLCFVVGKCRIAPMKQQTIPKLELQAALYAVRLRQLITQGHDIAIANVYHWTDSLTVLQWIHSARKKQQVFVANRIGEILDSSSVDEWRHVKGTMNPADIGTRGMTVSQLSESEWLTGPAWLRDPKDSWDEQITLEEVSELETTCLSHVQPPIVDWSRISSYRKLINVIVYCLRFRSKKKGPISVEEMDRAKLILLRAAQRESFPELAGCLAKGSFEKLPHNLGRLSPFLAEDGSMRLRGRLRRSELSFQTKHPMLLSAKHPLVILMLKQAHADNNHEGTEYVRNVLQQEYWIMGLRNALRSIKHQCIQCRKVSTQPLQPQMADFPKERLTGTNHPFQNTGIDYFGPFEVKFLRKTVKYWCCLFTCLTTRAVHIEVVDGLDTDACMMAITRFMARRGRPHMFISDNGTNFVGSAREFRELAIEWNQSAIHDQLAHQRIVWKFNPPGAPHFGGVWERLVRTCKKAMYPILGSRCLTLPVLTTTMCLVEQTLNGRPLTPVSHDPEDLEALTPNHFLLGPRVIASRYVDCRRLYQVAQGYNEMIWKRWTNEYLPQCSVRSKWHKPEHRDLKVGDLVWLVDESIKKTFSNGQSVGSVSWVRWSSQICQNQDKNG